MNHHQYIQLAIENGLATITLNRPQQLNAINDGLAEELYHAIVQVAQSDNIKAVLLTGAGRGFCSGADISTAPDKSPEALLAQGEASYQALTHRFNPIIQHIHEMNKPVIGAINGVAAGYGVSLALCCDLVFAAESASFIQVFVPNLGLVPDGGSTWLLPRLTTTPRAMGMFLTGEKIRAHQAEAWGMIWKCVPDDELLGTAKTAALRLAQGPTLGIRALKAAMNQSHENSLQRQLQLEAQLQKVCCGSEDFAEGCLAFAEKREPQFSGR